MIHLYAFATGLDRLPACTGVEGRRLEERRFGEMSAVVSVDVTEARRAEALAHGLVVEALRKEAVGVLPVRFGEQFPDEEALVDAVSAQLAELRAALARVARCVEFGVRIERQAEARPESGREYLEQKLALRALHDPLRRLARDSAGDAYLVPADDVPSFRRCVGDLAASHPEMRVTFTGPWAPYTFAGDVH